MADFDSAIPIRGIQREASKEVIAMVHKAWEHATQVSSSKLEA